jgi:hypothetical protein
MKNKLTGKMQKATLALAASAVILAAAGFRTPDITPGPIGLISKVVRDVTMRADAEEDWNRAERGNPLKSGDRVKTGPQSLAVLKFRDASFVRVREKSEIVMSTATGEKPIVKSIETDAAGGSFGFDIKKQTDAKFEFTSPTSVASIRGTTGKWSAGPDANDTLWLGTGLVALLNKISKSEILVRAGSIAFSNADGTITLRPMTPEELAEANLASEGGTERNLDLRFRNENGEEKDLKIKFRK